MIQSAISPHTVQLYASNSVINKVRCCHDSRNITKLTHWLART